MIPYSIYNQNDAEWCGPEIVVFEQYRALSVVFKRTYLNICTAMVQVNLNYSRNILLFLQDIEELLCYVDIAKLAHSRNSMISHIQFLFSSCLHHRFTLSNRFTQFSKEMIAGADTEYWEAVALDLK